MRPALSALSCSARCARADSARAPPSLPPSRSLADIFEPLFEVTADPSSHPELHVFLQRVIGFDSVDDESKAERRLYRKFPVPRDWNTTQNRASPRSFAVALPQGRC